MKKHSKDSFKAHHIPKISKALFRTLLTPLLVYFTLIGNIIMFTSAYAFYQFEKESNDTVSSYWDALWWAICTVSTVGYGDIYPITTLGKITGAFLILFGVVFFLGFVDDLYGEKNHLLHNIGEWIDLFSLSSDDSLKETWESLPRPYRNPQDEDLAKTLDQALKLENPISSLAQEFVFIINNHPQSFMNIAQDLAIALTEENTNLSREQKQIVMNFIDNPSSIAEEQIFTDNIAVEWRDQKLSENIISIYELAKADNKDLIVFIGCAHLESLKNKITTNKTLKEEPVPNIRLTKPQWCLQ